MLHIKGRHKPNSTLNVLSSKKALIWPFPELAERIASLLHEFHGDAHDQGSITLSWLFRELVSLIIDSKALEELWKDALSKVKDAPHSELPEHRVLQLFVACVEFLAVPKPWDETNRIVLFGVIQMLEWTRTAIFAALESDEQRSAPILMFAISQLSIMLKRYLATNASTWQSRPDYCDPVMNFCKKFFNDFICLDKKVSFGREFVHLFSESVCLDLSHCIKAIDSFVRTTFENASIEHILVEVEQVSPRVAPKRLVTAVALEKVLMSTVIVISGGGRTPTLLLCCPQARRIYPLFDLIGTHVFSFPYL